jgi:hypothetical protein
MKNFKLLFLLFSVLFCQVTTYADHAEDNARKFRDEGKNVAKSLESNISNSFTNGQQHQETMGFEGVNIRGSNMSIEEAENVSMGVIQLSDEQALKETKGESVTYECNKNHCDVGDVFSSIAIIQRKEELEKQGFTKDDNNIPVNNLGFLDKAIKYSKNSEFDFLNSKNIQCPSITENLVTTTEHTCDQYYDLKNSNCFPKQVVEIDPEYKYLCQKTRDEKIKTCNDEITSIQCKETQECDMGGIEKGTLASDMKFEFKNGVLTIGTIADNYWSGYCTIYDRATTFKITNKDKIKEFLLFKVGFDDYLQIILNDHLIYIGPDGGNKLEVKTIGHGFRSRQVVDNGSGPHACERNESWERNPNIDLKPYLKEGENIIKIRVIVAGKGEGWLQIRAKQNCCVNWDIKRETICNFS